MFAGNFAPRGWGFCNGQILPIAQYTALFSILGTTYGGDGQTTFALPDLRGRVPVHPGTGPGLSAYSLGQSGGAENVTLTEGQIPSHTHALNVAEGDAVEITPSTARVLGRAAEDIYTDAAPTSSLSPGAVASSGGSQPHPNVQPYRCVNFIIALEGIFPSRS